MRKTKTKKAISLVLTLMFALSIFAVVPAQEAEAATTYKTLPIRNVAADACHTDANQITVVVDSSVMEARHNGRTFRLDMSIPSGFDDSSITVTPGQNVANINGFEGAESYDGRSFSFDVEVGTGTVQEIREDFASVYYEVFGGNHNFYVSDYDLPGLDLFTINEPGDCTLDAIIGGPADVDTGEINISPLADLPANFSIVFWELVYDEDLDDFVPELLRCELVQRVQGYYDFTWTTLEEVDVDVPFDPTEDLEFTINFDSLCVPVGFTGDINATFTAAPETVDGDTPVLGTIFDDATVLIARVGVSRVAVSMSGVNFITDSNVDNDIAVIRLIEEIAGAMGPNDVVKLKLPRGFYWDSNLHNTSVGATIRYGELTVGDTVARVDVRLEDASDLLRTKFQTMVLSAPYYQNTGDYALDSGKISRWDIGGGQIRIIVDPMLAQKGAVDVALSGVGVSATPASMTVARYGDYVATPEALSAPTLLAGKMNQKLGSFEIREEIGASLLANRTITLTLPEGAKWIPGTDPFDAPQWETGGVDDPFYWFWLYLRDVWWTDEYSFIVDNANAPTFDEDESTRRSLRYGISDELDGRWMMVDADRRTIRTTVLVQSTGGGRAGAHLVFKDAGRIAIEPTFRGELVVEVGGTAGASGEIVLGNVVAPVVAEEVDPVQIIAGQPNQELPNIVLTESVKGAASRTDATSGIITLKVPDPRYATFSQRPTAEVTDGDMVIERIWMSADRTAVNIQVVASSDVASTIEVSDLMVTLDRAVPYGDFNLQLTGDAIIDDPIPTRLYFLDSDVMQEVKVATVVDEITPVEVMMWIGSTTYTIDGVAGEMDVAPFIENDRTFVPVRFIAQGFGVSEDDIDWGPQDELTEWVTIEHDGKLITITIGDPVIVVEEDGVTTTVLSDVAAQIINDRTYLPIRAVGEILGAEFDWGPKETLTEWVSFTYWK